MPICSCRAVGLAEADPSAVVPLTFATVREIFIRGPYSRPFAVGPLRVHSRSRTQFSVFRFSPASVYYQSIDF